MSLWIEISRALDEARSTIGNYEGQIRYMAELCAGHLRSGKAHHRDLVKLKRELRDYNTRTGKWRGE